MKSQSKNIRKYEIFKEVLSTGSISLAASRLGLTQPAVSTAITNLEAELGFSLFKRSYAGTSLTAEAEFMLPAVEKLLASANHLNEVTEELKCGRAGKIHIACMPGFPSIVAPKIIANVLKSNPMLNVAFKIFESTKIQNGVRTGLFDLGIAEAPANTNELIVERFDYDLVAIFPKEHRLNDREILSIHDFENEPFITLDENHIVTNEIKALFVQNSVNLHVIAEVHLFSTIAIMVSEGLGVALVDEFTAKKFTSDPANNLAYAPVDFDIQLPLAVFTAKSKHISKSIDLIKTPLLEELTMLRGSHD